MSRYLLFVCNVITRATRVGHVAVVLGRLDGEKRQNTGLPNVESML